MSLGQIIVGELLTERATSLLYKAHDASSGKRLVLKVVRATDDGAELRRIEREETIVSSITRPGAVATFGVTSIEGLPALVREDFGARSLDTLVGTALPLARFLEIAIGVAAGLSDIHASNVVHCDVKPSNILLNEQTGEVKLTDFGLANASFVDAAPGVGMIPGSLPYLAPEQTGRLSRVVDSRADLYALGVTLYQLASGRLPFEGHDLLEWIHAHLAKQPCTLCEVAPQVPPLLSTIVHKLLAKAPEERYQTADGLRHDLARCLSDLESKGKVVDFALQQEDVADAFSVPHALYGREREVAQLRSLFEASASADRPHFLTISGAPGVGKSVLVAELQGPVAARAGYFASGKFEQFQRNTPYAAWVDAMGQLVGQIHAAGSERLEATKATLAVALGGNARVLVDAFPALGSLFGKLEPAALLGPLETQTRFQSAFCAFLSVVASSSHPLVLFIDDVQWVDPLSVALLDVMATGALRAPLLIVLAFREEALAREHPIRSLMARQRAADVTLEQIALTPLDERTVACLIADTLRSEDRAVAPLARVVSEKTAGNAFFVTQFLEKLYADGLFRFDRAQRSWRWNLAEIEAAAITDNVVDLLVGRLETLPDSTQSALGLASCVGNQFGLDLLAQLAGLDNGEAARELRPAVERGLLFVHHDLGGVVYRFRHDRVQQAAHATVSREGRTAARLRIATSLLDSLSAEALEASLFEVVNHLDEALALLVEPSARAMARTLNERAGRKAHATTAYADARRYFATALALTEEDWESDYDALFALHLDLAECEYLDGELAGARKRFDLLLEHASSDVDRAQVYYLQMRLRQVAGDYRGACELALQSFALFGLPAPDTESAAAACAELQREAEVLLKGQAVEALLERPLLADPTRRALANLLESSGPPIYMVRPELFQWITLQLLLISLKYGHCGASCYAYGIYALLRAATMADPEGGYAFAKLAIALSEKLGAVRLRGCMLHLLGDHVNFWKNPFASDLPILERGFKACLEGGDLIYSNYIAFQMPWHALEAGLPLAEVYKITESYAPFSARTNPAVHRTIRFEQQFIRDLQGLTVRRGSFEEDSFDEVEATRTIDSAQFACGIVYRHTLALIGRYLAGDVEGALVSAQLAQAQLGAAFSMPTYVSFVFYRALVSAARACSLDGLARTAFLETVRADLASLRQWAGGCPGNFADKAALVAAELARAEGRAADAIQAYEQAVAGARAATHVHVQALACELAGRFYGEAGAASIAELYQAEAVALYRRWGALGKAVTLQQTLDSGGEGRLRTRSDPWEASTTRTSSNSSANLDLLSVGKASQSISEELDLTSLLQRLVSIVVEYAGAQRGQLFLPEHGEMQVAAEATVDGAVAVLTGGNVEAPRSILQYVERSAEPVIVDDALLPNAFSDDPYFSGRRVRSLLCVPIVRHRKLAGLFYLENNLVPRAFSVERLEVIEVLSAQTAISLDNARLFAAAHEAIHARDEFLSLASHELKTPLTPLKLRVQGLLACLREGQLGELRAERLSKIAQTIENQVTRFATLIESLLDVSAFHQGRFELELRELDLVSIARLVVERFEGDFATAGGSLTLRAEAPATGCWDATRLTQLLTHLVNNALRHAPGSPVVVVVSTDNTHARLIVEDQGPGIPKAQQQRLFDRFARVERGSVAGLGLGLFAVRQLAEAHGGSVHVESGSERGTRFVVTLPRQSAGKSEALS